MGAAVSITRLDLTASELRKAASGEKNSAAARRILALALVLDGLDRKAAAETCGRDRQATKTAAGDNSSFAYEPNRSVCCLWLAFGSFDRIDPAPLCLWEPAAVAFIGFAASKSRASATW